MFRTAWLAVGLGIAASAGAGRPPVVAPKPAAVRVPGCAECRFLSAPRPTGRIVPVQDGPHFAAPESRPEPLPTPADATPLPPADATPLPPAEPAPGLRELVERYLPDASAEERGVWVDELRGLPPEIARDLLAARSRFGEPDALPEPPADGLVPPPQGEPEPQAEPAPLRSVPRYSDVSGVDASLVTLRQAEAVLLHNIANAETVGFKRLRPLTTESAGTGGAEGLTVRRVDTQGALEETGRPLDLAIDGPGLFQVRRGDTVALTRRGTFQVTADGELAVAVAGEDWGLHPPVRVPAEASEVRVGEDGVISCRFAGGAELGIGRIELARVADGSRLEPAGGGLLAVPESAGPVTVGLPGEEGFGTVRPGCLERSNVDLAEELKALRRTRRQLTALQGHDAP
ncbi:MAG TPA: flagellar hook-basal body complex protein, partial [Planctomycetaceae bacterium]